LIEVYHGRQHIYKLGLAFAIPWPVEQWHNAHHRHRAQDGQEIHHAGRVLPAGYLWILTSRDRQWWRNVKNGAKVSLLLKRKPVQGFAEAELDAQAVEARMFEYIKHVPMAVKPLGIRMENNTANAEDVARAARDRLFVKIKI
jgi:hypothetical protein